MQMELITFEVADQYFGLDIMAVREIRAWTPTTPLPQVPAYVAGVVNLRGTVLPVINLAARLGWKPTEATARNAIIVAQLAGQISGLIVDAVSDIVTIEQSALQAPPAAGAGQINRFVTGLTAINNRMVMVLDLDALASDDLQEAA
ncbi:chemotaxis protein CheW [Novosphingobium sp.]|uniref:chemotaxis protein CheW n=1 Tax=Novosphingobium sp. TaxID=1874826 RepID=UPI0035AE3435